MTAKTARILTITLTVVLAMVVGASLVAGNSVVPILALVVAIALNIFIRRTSKEVTNDERTRSIYDRASTATIRISVLTAVAVAFIIYAFRSRLPVEALLVANTLAYAGCVVLVLHVVFYKFYTRQS